MTAEAPTAAQGSPDTAWYFVPRAVYTGGNEVTLLRGGDRLFPAMCEAIGRATHEVWVATYIFHNDESALAIADALVAAARRGVRVRVVIDGFGSNNTLAPLEERLRSGGVVVVIFRPLHGWWSWLQPGQLRRLHQKLCVVDSDIAFVGGINIIDDCVDLHHGHTDTPRLDFAVRLRGPVVAPIEQTARAVWTRAMIGRDWRDEIISIVRHPQPLANVRRLLAAVRMRSRPSLPQAQLTPVRAAFVVRDNLRQRRSIERSYVEAINRASGRIDLISPYFYPGRAFMRALLRAARRGVRVRLVMQGRWDYRFAAMAAYAVYEQLLRRGVRIYEYTPAFLHAKVAVVDDQWATVGSSNIDPLSLLVNLEANVVVKDAEFTADLAGEIEHAIAASREVTLAEFSHRPSMLSRVFVAWAARLYVRLSGGSGQY